MNTFEGYSFHQSITNTRRRKEKNQKLFDITQLLSVKIIESAHCRHLSRIKYIIDQIFFFSFSFFKELKYVYISIVRFLKYFAIMS